MLPCHGRGRGFESRPARKKVFSQKLGTFLVMAYYVYIIQSFADNTFYKGYTEQPLKRLTQHNAGEMNYTSKKTPWKLVGLLIFASKKEALIAEKKLKKHDHQRLLSFINSDRNKLEEYLGSVG